MIRYSAKLSLWSTIFLLFCSCDNRITSPPAVIEYGNGVYYVKATGRDFGMILSQFKTNHEVISIASDNRGTYGYTLGYFIICKE